MRAWRKLESSIVTSERLAGVSDSAKWLFTLLLVAQDDHGCYPWTPIMIRSLTVTCSWGEAGTDALLSELRESGMITLEHDMVMLRNGADKNGTPSNSKLYPFTYPSGVELGTDTLPTRDSESGDTEPHTDKIRVDKSREEENTEPPMWLRTCRDIPGWTEKGEPYLEQLMGWIRLKGITNDQLERSAIGLGGVQSKTLKGYTNLKNALQRRINEGYDDGKSSGNVLAETPDNSQRYES